jgi:hypothetical protein
LPASPSLSPSPVYAPNLIAPAYQPGPSPIAALPLAALPPAGAVQAGTSTFISGSTVAYSAAAIGTAAAGGGTNLCRVFSSTANWIIG